MKRVACASVRGDACKVTFSYILDRGGFSVRAHKILDEVEWEKISQSH